MRGDQLPKIGLDYIVPKGGVDLVTPPLLLPPGVCRMAQNFEVDLEGGYSRIGGYERYAGQESVTRKSFYLATFHLYDGGMSNALAVPGAAQIQGDTSGATARILRKLTDEQVVSIRATASDLTDTRYPEYIVERYLVFYETVNQEVFLYDVSGTFSEGENISVLTEDGRYILYGLSPTSPSSPAPVDFRLVSSPIVLTEETAADLAVELDRAAMAFRGAVTAPVTSLYSTSYLPLAMETLSGCPFLFSVINSSLGGQALSALFPRLKSEWGRVSNQAQNYGWASAAQSDYTGYGGTMIGGVPEYLECVRYNFSGAANNERLYCVSGNTPAFSFHLVGDADAYNGWRGLFNTISTGMAVDTPEHIAAHKNRLFLSFGASLQYSVAGDPTSWTPVLGAGELAVGEQITKLQSVIGGETSVLLVYTTTRIYGLYGDSSSDFKLVLLASDIRVDPKSIQMFGQPIFLTERGVFFLSATDTFGNFALESVSNQVAPFLKRLAGRLVSSIVIPEKNQYRLFFDTGDGLYFTFYGTKLIGVMPVWFDRVPVVAHCHYDTDTNETEFLFAAQNNSVRVYRGDIGPSFDGRLIDAHMFLAFNSSRSARISKAYRHASLEIQTDGGFVAFKVLFETNYAARATLPTPEQDVDGVAVNAYSVFDDALWDEFYWDGNRVSPQEISLDGSGENLSLGIYSSSYTTWPFTLSGVILQYLARKVKRG